MECLLGNVQKNQVQISSGLRPSEKSPEKKLIQWLVRLFQIFQEHSFAKSFQSSSTQVDIGESDQRVRII